jgi:hypothetical protein
MDRLISEQKAIEAINDYWGEMETPTIDGYINAIKAIPSAEPKTGHWIDYDCNEDKYDKIKCSECGHSFIVDSYHWCDIGFTEDDLKYCPNCGADMRGEQNG